MQIRRAAGTQPFRNAMSVEDKMAASLQSLAADLGLGKYQGKTGGEYKFEKGSFTSDTSPFSHHDKIMLTLNADGGPVAVSGGALRTAIGLGLGTLDKAARTSEGIQLRFSNGALETDATGMTVQAATLRTPSGSQVSIPGAVAYEALRGDRAPGPLVKVLPLRVNFDFRRHPAVYDFDRVTVHFDGAHANREK